jgi:hypothetical protein
MHISQIEFRGCLSSGASGVGSKGLYLIFYQVLDNQGMFWIYWSLKGRIPMSHDSSRTRPPLYSQIDVTPPTYPNVPAGRQDLEQTRLLREILAAQDRQNELLEEMVNHFGQNQKQRNNELGQWKQSNPRLANNCRKAAEALGKVQTEFLESLTAEVNDNYENLLEGEFMLNEFVDRFGPRMAHLNGLLQVLSQLSATPNPTGTPNTP